MSCRVACLGGMTRFWSNQARCQYPLVIKKWDIILTGDYVLLLLEGWGGGQRREPRRSVPPCYPANLYVVSRNVAFSRTSPERRRRQEVSCQANYIPQSIIW